MPEGDTVYRTARRLNEALAGAEVTRFELRVPQAATVDFRGFVVRDVVSRGKHLLHHIGDFTLHSHLKMEGEWHVYRGGERWRAAAFRARAVIGATAPSGEAWETVGFDLADISVVPTRDEEQLVGHLGPDPLSPAWDPVEAARRLGADPRPVHVALQDQRNVAGFGNEYANEILFVRGILPTASANEIDAAAVIDLGARMIRANRDRSGRIFTGDTRPGRSTWVYGREGRPCRRCGTSIRRGSLGADPTRERIVFWCPVCQTAPSGA
ncbi:DNA-formamidopyrimidine glycosylase family protein [Microbacterium sp. CFBP9034]|uniref:DNA-formamidopyrimidine glycosylase family protein n=1 Tax=Microbacterium sp. CFBP9034 TaxID=3096540 RepID=UPI002A6B3921|nr:DNA-formamidopyrimidine glycosylase family protein [Microbacterium sp. CFBP9034]MDY0910269.1 DNA-formamidopyrimidine glycosylase family protein [Microbacterium sp. CFBP9034]